VAACAVAAGVAATEASGTAEAAGNTIGAACFYSTYSNGARVLQGGVPVSLQYWNGYGWIQYASGRTNNSTTYANTQYGSVAVLTGCNLWTIPPGGWTWRVKAVRYDTGAAGYATNTGIAGTTANVRVDGQAVLATGQGWGERGMTFCQDPQPGSVLGGWTLNPCFILN